MSKPPFTMSKYLNELDLQRDARQYYQDKYEQLHKLYKELTDNIHIQLGEDFIHYFADEELMNKFDKVFEDI